MDAPMPGSDLPTELYDIRDYAILKGSLLSILFIQFEGYDLRAAEQLKIGKLQIWKDQHLTWSDYPHSLVETICAFCLYRYEFRIFVYK